MAGCSTPKTPVDAIYYNGVVYTVDSSFTVKEAFALKDGLFEAIGSSESILTRFEATEKIDLKGKSVYPGFYDAHCHFLGYGLSLQQVNLAGTSSFDEVISRVVTFANENPNLEWISGRGWDQNDWEAQQFPTNDTLNKLFPKTPVALRRIDGHGLLANEEAIRRSGVDFSQDIEGGDIIRANGMLTGVFMDNAAQAILDIIPEPTHANKRDALLSAQENCFAVGLTTIHDAGLPLKDILLMDSLQKSGELNMQIYAMLEPSEDAFTFAKKGPYTTEKLHVSGFKVYADGALGSRGACLKNDYSDRPGHTGFMVYAHDSLQTVANRIYDLGFQMNTHCIGDSANKTLLHIYAQHLKENNDRRWRIEHAQVMDAGDFSLFQQYSIIPSVQPTHCTSDMYWAADRVGKERITTSYAYKTLLQQNGIVAAGSDFPIEGINPLYGFYAAIERKDHTGYPEGGFYAEEALTREEALKAMTIWAAYAAFEEKEKGSIEIGKQADFVITEKDLMKANAKEIITPIVSNTFINGKMMYSK